jgi:hypothetical protein
MAASNLACKPAVGGRVHHMGAGQPRRLPLLGAVDARTSVAAVPRAAGRAGRYTMVRMPSAILPEERVMHLCSRLWHHHTSQRRQLRLEAERSLRSVRTRVMRMT